MGLVVSPLWKSKATILHLSFWWMAFQTAYILSNWNIGEHLVKHCETNPRAQIGLFFFNSGLQCGDLEVQP